MDHIKHTTDIDHIDHHIDHHTDHHTDHHIDHHIDEIGHHEMETITGGKIIDTDHIITHEIKHGETIDSIITKYGITIDALKTANPTITDFNTITEGTIIHITK